MASARFGSTEGARFGSMEHVRGLTGTGPWRGAKIPEAVGDEMLDPNACAVFRLVAVCQTFLSRQSPAQTMIILMKALSEWDLTMGREHGRLNGVVEARRRLAETPTTYRIVVSLVQDTELCAVTYHRTSSRDMFSADDMAILLYSAFPSDAPVVTTSPPQWTSKEATPMFVSPLPVALSFPVPSREKAETEAREALKESLANIGSGTDNSHAAQSRVAGFCFTPESRRTLEELGAPAVIATCIAKDCVTQRLLFVANALVDDAETRPAMATALKTVALQLRSVSTSSDPDMAEFATHLLSSIHG